jgi:hypothetical protein
VRVYFIDPGIGGAVWPRAMQRFFFSEKKSRL